MKTVSEGWSDMRPGDRVYHYMVDGDSLCGRVGFHAMLEETISQHDGGTTPGKKDCKACFRGLMKRLAAPSSDPGSAKI